MNKLTNDEVKKIWVPQVLFKNTKDQDTSKKDDEAYVLVFRNGTGRRSDSDIPEDIEVFEGEENSITLVRVYAIDFICEYDMGWYPFDIQTCNIDLELEGYLADFIDILPGTLAYNGPKKMSQYIIIETHISSAKKNVQVSITLGRELLGAILTAYIPTILMLIISHNANFFNPFFFEAAITMNVTSMLVLATLFISISGSLPTTSYIKMMDIWMIFSLLIPFFEVLLHTYMDSGYTKTG